jgi:poly [ADP-ribose] polymerase 10/14/15
MESIRSERTEVKEMQLFHGTNEHLINVIANEGFDPTKNTRAAYGYGTYFAKNASYSSNYMQTSTKNSGITYMFLADVLVGKLDKYKLAYNTGYDNNVDNLTNPTIITTPYANGAYPRYIIAFHKNAK